MKNYLKTILCMAVCSLLCVSCASKRQRLVYSYNVNNQRPVFWVEYQPYPEFPNTTDFVRPVPMYHGWTDERMERDLRRMQFAGITGILITIRPQDIAQQHARERCKHFYELVQKKYPSIKLALYFTAGDGHELSMPLQNVMNFFQYQGFGEYSNSIQINGKTVLFLDKSMILTGGYIGRYSYIRFGKEWPDKTIWAGNAEITNPQKFAWAIAANNGGIHFSMPGILNKWPISRDNGKSLFAAVQNAVQKDAKIICISSWNNYKTGSYIEENTYDHAAMLWTLKYIQEDLDSPQPNKE
ncbi:MAG: hypothetical protein WCS73_09470 [Lentisphaeria bacterium]